jgi:hypothetical protein
VHSAASGASLAEFPGLVMLRVLREETAATSTSGLPSEGASPSIVMGHCPQAPTGQRSLQSDHSGCGPPSMPWMPLPRRDSVDFSCCGGCGAWSQATPPKSLESGQAQPWPSPMQKHLLVKGGGTAGSERLASSPISASAAPAAGQVLCRPIGSCQKRHNLVERGNALPLFNYLDCISPITNLK